MTFKDNLGKTMHILLFLLGHWPGGIKLSCRKSHYPEQPYEDRKQVERQPYSQNPAPDACKKSSLCPSPTLRLAWLSPFNLHICEHINGCYSTVLEQFVIHRHLTIMPLHNDYLEKGKILSIITGFFYFLSSKEGTFLGLHELQFMCDFK